MKLANTLKLKSKKLIKKEGEKRTKYSHQAALSGHPAAMQAVVANLFF